MSLVPLPVAIPLGISFLLAGVHRHLSPSISRPISALVALANCLFCITLTVSAMNAPATYWFGGWTPRSGVALGIDFYVDPIAGAIGALTSFLCFVSFIYSRFIENVGTLFDVLMLGFLAAMCGFAFSGDVFNMFVFFELMSAAAFALCGYKLEESSVTQGAFNFAITNTTGAFFGLMGIGLLYAKTGALNLAQMGAAIGTTPNVYVATSFVLLITGFLVKSGSVPFHFWLADAHAVAPTPVCLLFSGVMVELGLYAIARIYWTVFEGAFSAHRAPVMNTLLLVGVLSAVVGALMCFGQRNIKRLLAFSTISHVGLMTIGVGMLSAGGMAGFILYVIGHGLVKGALFLNAGVLLDRFQSVDELELHSMGRKLPACGILFAVAGIMLAGAPISVTFLGEHAISGETEHAGLGLLWLVFLFAEVITAGAILRLTGRVFLGWGKKRPADAGARNIPEKRETKKGGGKNYGWMLVPQSCMLVAAFGCMFIPQLGETWRQGARFFVDRSSYYGTVMMNTAALGPIPFERSSLTSSLLHSLLATALAIALAGLALSPLWPGKDSVLHRFASPVQFVRKLHSGHVGDYVAFLIFGIACLVAVLWLQIR